MATILSSLVGAPNTRASTPQMMERGLRKIWGTAYKLHDRGYLEEIYSVSGSEKKTESDILTSALGVAILTAEGAEPTFDSLQEVLKTQWTHLKYTLGVEFTEEAIEDNLYWQIAQIAGTELGKSMAYTRQVTAMDIWNNLSSTVYACGGSNYGLLSTAHFMVNGSTWANRPTTATGLSVSSLEERLQAWSINMVDQRGRKYDYKPEILMVGASNELLAHRLITSTLRPQSGDNDVNVIRTLRNLRVVMNPHLTDDGRWFLLASKENTKLVFFDRVKPMMRKYDNSDTGNLKYVSRMRNSHGACYVDGIAGVPGS